MEPQDAEPRKPKRKVAVLISYAGTGYKGMQINNHERTIEGDLFAAFVAAGLVSRANSVDPRKVSLSRCARTDKGVHAAGNVVSLKLILEGGDLVRRINEKLPPQIRVWDVLRTNNNFNCYSQCDSRRYEYLLPSYCLLPPHPGSYLGKRIIEEAKKKGEAALEEVRARWKDVEGYWEKVDREEIWPILRALDDETRREVLSRMHDVEEVDGKWEGTRRSRSRSRSRSTTPPPPPVAASRDEGVTPKQEERAASQDEPMPDAGTEAVDKVQADGGSDIATKAVRDAVAGDESAPAKPGDAEGPNGAEEASAALTPAEVALRAIRNVYRQAKRRYRVTPTRLAQLQQVLDLYKGTHSFHNYTVSMSLKDASARRHIKSFVATPEPVVVGDTEWLSLRVHGQSFMMHQIRKMVAMAVLIVRCAADLSRIAESYGPARISIPKAPGLGLLLERPLFHGYNKRARESLGVQEIDFDRYKEQIDEFKHREIYSRVWEGEEKENA